MLYITKVTLDKKSIYFGHVVFDCAETHRFVMSLFPQIQTSSARVDGRILYTFEQGSDNTVMYIQSAVAPQNPEKPMHKALILSMNTVDAKGILSTFKEGKEFDFMVLGNPSVNVLREAPDKYHRLFLTTPAKRKEWLETRMGGCVIKDMKEGERIKVSGFKKNSHVRLEGMKFTGRLEITDCEAFTRTYLEGIGQGKSYGLGMIMLYPPKG